MTPVDVVTEIIHGCEAVAELKPLGGDPVPSDPTLIHGCEAVAELKRCGVRVRLSPNGDLSTAVKPWPN